MRVQFTSAKEAGQIYMPEVNWLLLVAVLLAVLGLAAPRRWPRPTALR
jgi:KUP system potassium uptake protein